MCFLNMSFNKHQNLIHWLMSLVSKYHSFIILEKEKQRMHWCAHEMV